MRIIMRYTPQRGTADLEGLEQAIKRLKPTHFSPDTELVPEERLRAIENLHEESLETGKNVLDPAFQNTPTLLANVGKKELARSLYSIAFHNRLKLYHLERHEAEPRRLREYFSTAQESLQEAFKDFYAGNFNLAQTEFINSARMIAAINHARLNAIVRGAQRLRSQSPDPNKISLLYVTAPANSKAAEALRKDGFEVQEEGDSFNTHFDDLVNHYAASGRPLTAPELQESSARGLLAAIITQKLRAIEPRSQVVDRAARAIAEKLPSLKIEQVSRKLATRSPLENVLAEHGVGMPKTAREIHALAERSARPLERI